jgi:hypothetical protein
MVRPWSVTLRSQKRPLSRIHVLRDIGAYLHGTKDAKN